MLDKSSAVLKEKKDFSGIEPSERVLLLSHCMRPSQKCPAKFSKTGLRCLDDCGIDCVVGRLRRAALDKGYKGICIAAGGKMALKFVIDNNPKGIVAIACRKELEEGVNEVSALANGKGVVPMVVVVPLLQDGCIDTEVDEVEALSAINAGLNL